MEFYFEPIIASFDECKTDADCGENKYCDMGLCFNGWKPEITALVFDTTCDTNDECNKEWNGNCSSCHLGYCTEDTQQNNQTCTLSDGTVGKCAMGKCLPIGCTYEINKCGKNKYCANPNNSCTEAFQANETGVCVSATKRFTQLKIDNKTYYISNSPLSWWDGTAGCKALGFDGLVSLDDLITNSPAEFTALGQALLNKIPSSCWNIWTRDMTSDSNSCNVHTASPNYHPDLTTTVNRNNTNSLAICK